MSNPLKKIYYRYFSRKAVPYWLVLSLDCFIVFFSSVFVSYLACGGGWCLYHRWRLLANVLAIVAVYGVFFKLFHTYYSAFRYSSFVDLKNVALSNLSASVTILFTVHFLYFRGFGDYVLFGIWPTVILLLFVTLFMWLERILVKIIFDGFRTSESAQGVFIYGTGAGAVALAKGLQGLNGNYHLSGFVNPDSDTRHNKFLMGVRVWGDDLEVVSKMKEKGVSHIMVSPLMTERFRSRTNLVNSLIDSGIRIVMVPNPEEWDGKSDISSTQLKEVDIEDLLPREEIKISLSEIENQLRGKRVMITGAAGSIGFELVRQIALFHPSQMMLVDQAETPMHNVLMMMEREFGRGCQDKGKRVDSDVIVGSITDLTLMEELFSVCHPDYVFHAAAYKHVPMMENNPAVAIRNNLYGTRVIADLAVKYGASKFVMISSDKAVNPTNVMGCSKRLCEIYCQSLNNAIRSGRVKGKTQFVTTRFGNVLGSSGSVIPIFKEQISHGGPVTVTDPEIIRYFMLTSEACKLVLEAGVMGEGGEIFAFDMGEPVKIADLARKMIALSGAEGVKIVFTGLRDGEKLYEEVLSGNEKTMPTPHPKIWVASVKTYDYEQACKNEERLVEASYHSSAYELVKMMEEIVPEYRSNNDKYRQETA